jgi:hypothetical protein
LLLLLGPKMDTDHAVWMLIPVEAAHDYEMMSPAITE